MTSPDGVTRNDVLLFVTDAAPYMKKAAKVLTLLYPKMIDVMCLAHALHRVSEEARINNPEVDQLIANGKKIFLKASLRVQKLKETALTLSLPPQPVLTRWGTWFDAVQYYCSNYDSFKAVVQEFDPYDSSSVRIVQNLFTSDSLTGNLAYIISHFGGIPRAITRLETVGLPLSDTLDIVKNIQCDLRKRKGEMAEKILKNRKECSSQMKAIICFVRYLKFSVDTKQHLRILSSSFLLRI